MSMKSRLHSFLCIWALASTFTTSKYALLILKGYVMTVMKGRGGEFYAFESQARNAVVFSRYLWYCYCHELCRNPRTKDFHEKTVT